MLRAWHSINVVLLSLLSGFCATAAFGNNTITVADASLTAAFYSDSSCLLTIDDLAQSGQTVIDADVDDDDIRFD